MRVSICNIHIYCIQCNRFYLSGHFMWAFRISWSPAKLTARKVFYFDFRNETATGCHESEWYYQRFLEYRRILFAGGLVVTRLFYDLLCGFRRGYLRIYWSWCQRILSYITLPDMGKSRFGVSPAEFLDSRRSLYSRTREAHLHSYIQKPR